VVAVAVVAVVTVIILNVLIFLAVGLEVRDDGV